MIVRKPVLLRRLVRRGISRSLDMLEELPSGPTVPARQLLPGTNGWVTSARVRVPNYLVHVPSSSTPRPPQANNAQPPGDPRAIAPNNSTE